MASAGSVGRSPPQRSCAPSAIPAATYASTLARCPAEMSGPVSASGSNGPPRRIRPARSTNASTKRSCIPSWTISRAPAEQTWPECRNTAVRAMSRAAVEVGIVEHDVGVLATQLQRDLLHRLRGLGHDPLPGRAATGERHQVDPWIGAQRIADRRARAEDEVGHPAGQARLLQRPHEQDGGGRRQFAGLQHDGVAGQQRRCDLPGRLQKRIVPRGDQGADAHGGVHDPADRIGATGVDHAAGVGAADAGEVSERGDDVVHVVFRLDQTLAGVHGLGVREILTVALDDIGDPGQQLAALAFRRGPPRPMIEGVAGGGDGRLGVGGRSLSDARHELAVSGAVDLSPAAVEGRAPRPVDVELTHPAVLRVAYRAK